MQVQPFSKPRSNRTHRVEVYEDCPASEESLKGIERDLDLLQNPDAKTRKRLEKALSKMMQIE